MNSLNIGDILVSSWRYDQTNIDYYQIISKTSKMVTVRMIRKKHLDQPHFMASNVMPIKDSFLESDHIYDKSYGSPFTRKVLQGYDNHPLIKISSCTYAYKWNGKPKTETYTG